MKIQIHAMKSVTTLLLTAFMLAACSPHSAYNSGKKKILVTILPEKSFVEKIAGNDFEITVMVPPGANPAVYSLLPSQMVDVSKAAAWFRMGSVGFELSTAGKIVQLNPGMKVIDLSAGLDLISFRQQEDLSRVSGYDPHTWLSPGNVETMVSQMLKELVSLNPGKENVYTSAYRRFISEIRATRDSVQLLLQDRKGKKIISFHPSLSYFARDFGLVQLSLEEGGKEPAPALVAQLVTVARQEGIRTIYIQSDFDREIARTFATEIGGSIRQIRPLDPDWSANLISIARQIRENP
jgi:zinc transport system substrate-binding protein